MALGMAETEDDEPVVMVAERGGMTANPVALGSDSFPTRAHEQITHTGR